MKHNTLLFTIPKRSLLCIWKTQWSETVSRQIFRKQKLHTFPFPIPIRKFVGKKTTEENSMSADIPVDRVSHITTEHKQLETGTFAT